ncbi:hypothetical protein RYX36_004427 [Vicia faba]
MDPNDKGKAAAKSEEQPPQLKQLVSALTPLRVPVQEHASSSSTSPSTRTLSPLDSPLRLRDPASSSLSTMQFTPAAESPVKRMLRQQASLSPTKEKVQESRESSPRRAPYSRPQVLPHPDHEQHYDHQHHNENEQHDEEGEQEDAQVHIRWYYSPTCLVISGALLAFFIAFIVWFIVTSVHVLKHHQHQHHHSSF